MTTQELKQYIDRVLGNNIRCLLPSYWWKKLFGEVVDNIDSISKSTKNSIDKLTSKVENVSLAIDITYDELYRKRENSELVPGQSYRIIDYECTINDNDPDLVALSPEDPRFERFCIVVTALTNNQLSENASATMDSRSGTSETDEKTSWEIKYSLLNDTNKYHWARVGSKSYDVATLFLPDGNSTNKPGCFYWDENSQKYIAEGLPHGTYLVTSLTDNTPLPQTTFNYGDTLYVLWGSTIIETVACYTDSMKDTGDAVLLDDRFYIYPFVWNPSLDNYYCPINNESYYTFEQNGKRDSFNANESFKIREAEKTYIDGEISNGELFVLISGTECLKIEWDSNENKYLGTVGSEHFWLCESSDNNTPIAQTTFNTDDIVYVSTSNNTIIEGIVCYTGTDNTTDRLMFKVPSFNVYFCVQFDNSYKLISYNDGEIKVNNESYLVDTNTKLPLDKIDNIIEGESVSISTPQFKNAGSWNTIGFFVPDGKGVIYYLKDHKNNEAFYDFKNILFRFPEIDENPRFTFHGESNYDGEDLNIDYSRYSSNTKIDKPKLNRSINKVSLYYSTDSVVVSGEVYNKCFTVNYNYKHIGLDSNNNLTITNIHDYLSKIEQLNQDLIEDEKVTASALLDLNKRKQDTLVSGKNIKTYNGKSILEEGDIGPDTELNEKSNNAISNKAVSDAINELNASIATFEYNSDETNAGLLTFTLYAFLLNNDNSFANFAHNIFIRPIGTENTICFVTGMYADENNQLVVEYVYKGKCWKRIASESGDSFEDVEIV